MTSQAVVAGAKYFPWSKEQMQEAEKVRCVLILFGYFI
jgi:hypothetical protein